MRKKKHPEHVNHERWLVSFADFMTLLFAFFVVMFSVSQVDSQKVGRFTQSFQAAIGIELVPGGQGIMPSEGAGMFPGDKPPEEVPEEGGKGKGKGKGKGGNKDELKALAEALEAQAKVRKELAGLKIVRRGNELVLRLEAAWSKPASTATCGNVFVRVGGGGGCVCVRVCVRVTGRWGGDESGDGRVS